MYVYIHTYIHTYIYTYIHTYIHTYKFGYVYRKSESLSTRTMVVAHFELEVKKILACLLVRKEKRPRTRADVTSLHKRWHCFGGKNITVRSLLRLSRKNSLNWREWNSICFSAHEDKKCRIVALIMAAPWFIDNIRALLSKNLVRKSKVDLSLVRVALARFNLYLKLANWVRSVVVSTLFTKYSVCYCKNSCSSSSCIAKAYLYICKAVRVGTLHCTDYGAPRDQAKTSESGFCVAVRRHIITTWSVWVCTVSKS